MVRNHLSRLLGEKRWTQARLAQVTGIRPTTINDIYHEMAERINLDHLDRICEALECDLSELIEYVPNSVQKTGQNLLVEDHGNRKQNAS